MSLSSVPLPDPIPVSSWDLWRLGLGREPSLSELVAMDASLVAGLSAPLHCPLWTWALENDDGRVLVAGAPGAPGVPGVYYAGLGALYSRARFGGPLGAATNLLSLRFDRWWTLQAATMPAVTLTYYHLTDFDLGRWGEGQLEVLRGWPTPILGAR